MINKDKFFEGYSSKFGSLNDSQKEGLTEILDFLDASSFELATSYAYILSTIKCECNGTWKPEIEGYYIAESKRVKSLFNYYSKNNRPAVPKIFPYGIADEKIYYGRGYCQLTLLGNYEKYRDLIMEKFGVDIVEHPDEVLTPEISWFIIEKGLTDRVYSFTGKILSDYINDSKTDYYYARLTINGIVKKVATDMASDAEKFESIIEFV